MSRSLVLMILFVGACVTLVANPVQVYAQESAELAAMREKMKSRQRRIIYNNDGNDIFNAAANTPDGFLALRMKPALDTQVDSIFFCTGAATMFTHQAKVGEIYGKYGPKLPLTKNIQALNEQYKTDSLALAVQFCHENDLEVFFTYRINDIHDCFKDFELSTWKREHPEYLMGKMGDWEKYDESDPRRRWAALDFEIPEVREYLLAIIDDVLSRYDLDGIEIDYLRNPLFFRSNRAGESATDEQVEILTDFQRDIRNLAYKHGNRRGRPILVATRTPVTKRMSRYVGIDVELWLKEDLLDVLTTAVGCMPYTNPMRELVELGHAHGVPVYPTIAGSGRPDHQTIEHWRGAISNFWHAGADGVYLFNTFPGAPQHPHFTELGDPKKLAFKSKIFAIDNQGIFDGGIAHAIMQSQILPVELDGTGNPREVTLPIGDDVASAAKEGRLKLLELRVQFEGRASEDMVEVCLNGDILESAKEDTSSGWVTYVTDPPQYRHGENFMVFSVKSPDKIRKPRTVKSVELRVEYL